MAKSKYVKADTAVVEAHAWQALAHMTPEQISIAVHWYYYARRQCETAAVSLGVDTETFIGVVAALSPGRQWMDNVKDAIMLVVWYQHGGNWRDLGKTVKFQVGYSYVGIQQAWKILQTGDTSHLRGPKVVPFFRSIMNCKTAPLPAIDYHMVGIGVGWTASALTFGPKIRRAIEQLCFAIADWFGIAVAQAQSLLWQAQLFAEARARV